MAAPIISGDSLEEDFVLEDDFAPDASQLSDADLPTAIDVLLSDDEDAPSGGVALSEGPAKKKRKLEGKDKDDKRESKRQAKKLKVDRAEADKQLEQIGRAHV